MITSTLIVSINLLELHLLSLCLKHVTPEVCSTYPFLYIFCSCLLLLLSCIHIVPLSNPTFSSRLFLRAMTSQQNGKDDSGGVEGNLPPNLDNLDTSMDFEFQSQLLADLQQEAFLNNRKRSADDPAMNSIRKTSKVVSTENNGTTSSPSTPPPLTSNGSPHHTGPNTNILSGRLPSRKNRLKTIEQDSQSFRIVFLNFVDTIENDWPHATP